VFKHKDLQRLTDLNSILSLSDLEFEYCCKFLLEEAGYGKTFVTRKGPKGGDGGIDLDIYSSGNKLIACGQCKLWKGRYKGLMKPLRELCGSMKIKGVSRGVFIVTVEATPEEKREAQLMDIEMIDATALLELVRQCATTNVKNSHPVVAVAGYVCIGAVRLFFSLLSSFFRALQEMNTNDHQGYYRKGYRRSGKKYHRRRHTYHRSYDF